MPGYNLINGWTAASLTPASTANNSLVPSGMSGTNPVIRPTTLNQTPGSNSTFNLPQQGVGGNLMDGLLSAIYGPGYQSLLNTNAAGQQNGMGGPRTVVNPADQAQADLDISRASAIGNFEQQQRRLVQLSGDMARGQGGVPSAFGNMSMASDRQNQAQFDLLQSILGGSGRVAQAAAYSPPRQQAGGGAGNQNYMVGAPATGNPNGSGWISPSQAFGMNNLGQSAFSLMGTGI